MVHRRVSHLLHELAVGLFGDLFRERFPFVLKILEAQFHELKAIERFIECHQKLRRESGLAKANAGFDELSPALELPK